MASHQAFSNLSDETIKRMFSFFSRHEVDKQAEGFYSGEDGYPSNGRIAWALWGGDAGFSWSKRLVEQMDDDRDYEEEMMLRGTEETLSIRRRSVSTSVRGGRVQMEINHSFLAFIFQFDCYFP